ncbi:PTPLA domain containing protein [Amanita muscaria]
MAPNNSKPAGLLKAYLIAYNLLSALGWSHILARTLHHLLQRPQSPISPTLRTQASTTYDTVGKEVMYVQTAAILEMIHALLAWVKSPLLVTGSQVITRLLFVWGIIGRFRNAQISPSYAHMILIWSMAELARYPFYALSLLSFKPKLLTYLRYTLFYVLMPCGGVFEYLVISSTLPSWKEFVEGRWKFGDFWRLSLILIGFPGVIMLYRQRIVESRKVLGSMHSSPQK